MLSLGWFSTGRGEGSRGLLQSALDSLYNGQLNARILFVFCNRDPGEHSGSDKFMDLARNYGLPLITFSSRRFQHERGAPDIAAVRQEYHEEVMQYLKSYTPDLCVLAGYGLIMSPEMCQKYTILNLHPALPGGPVGTWKQVIWKLIEARASRHGVLVHLATEELDLGPPVTYTSFPIRGEGFDVAWQRAGELSAKSQRDQEDEKLELFHRIRQEGMRRERPLLMETLRAFASGRLRVTDRQVIDTHGRPIAGLCLDDEVEKALAKGTYGTAQQSW